MNRTMSVEIRQAVAWMSAIFAPVAWCFGLVGPKAALAAVTAAVLLALSTVQPKR